MRKKLSDSLKFKIKLTSDNFEIIAVYEEFLMKFLSDWKASFFFTFFDFNFRFLF